MRSANHHERLEKGAYSNLWRNTLSLVPSVFGRLVYLSALRNQNTGRYEHHGLGLLFGEDEANKALRKSHSLSFAEWINFDLEQQKADLCLYLAGLQEDTLTVLQTWSRFMPYRNLVPNSVRPLERRLYLADLDAILNLLRNEYGVAEADPNASQRR